MTKLIPSSYFPLTNELSSIVGEVVGKAAVRCRDGGCELQRTITELRKDLAVWVPMFMEVLW